LLGGAVALVLGGSSGVAWLWQWGGLLLMALGVIWLSNRRMGGDWSWSWQWPQNWQEGEVRTLLLWGETTKKSEQWFSRAWLELELVGQDQLTCELACDASGRMSPQRLQLRSVECGMAAELVLRWRGIEPAGCLELRRQWLWQQPGAILPRAVMVSNAAALYREAITQSVAARAWRESDGWQRVDWRGSGRSWARQRVLQLRQQDVPMGWSLVLHSFSAVPEATATADWQDFLRSAMALVQRALLAGRAVTVRCPAWQGAPWQGRALADLPDLALRLLKIPASPSLSWDELRRELQSVPAAEELWVLSDQAMTGWARRCLSLPHLRLQKAQAWQLREEGNP
jgi:hypothetical protein